MEVGIDPDLGAGHAAAAALLDPVLQARVHSGMWDPTSLRWKA